MADTPLGYYKWYPRDFYTSLTVRSMSFTARAIYRELLDLQWESERLPNAKQTLSVLQISLEQWNEFAPYVDELFPNGQNERLKMLRLEAVERSQKAAKSGSKGGKSKRTPSKRLPNAKRTLSQTETETETDKVDKSTSDVAIKNTFLTKEGAAAWSAFVDHRKSINHKLTPPAVILILNKLAPFDEGQKIALLEEAIERGWRSVFPKDNIHAPKPKPSEPILGIDYMIDLETGKRIAVSEYVDED